MEERLTRVVSTVLNRRLHVWILATLSTLPGGGPGHAAEVNGIYTEPTTKDLGELTKVDLLKGIKIRGWIDGYFEGNFNHPKRSTVNANQDLSVVKSRDLTTEGRGFDVHDQ